MARILNLGHVGIYVRDLDKMVAFYRDVMGMTITKQNGDIGMVFFSADPEAVDHEIALMRGRPLNQAEDPHLINQISLRVGSLDEVREFKRRVEQAGCKIDYVVNHGSAIGCYFFDPEGNRTEVFWVTGRPCWVPTQEPVDLEQPDEAIIAHANRIVERHQDVPVGGRAPATVA
jgi:catechol 2,3-dioxygenase-like lactoylglutathione lyase family enzyme